MDSRKRFVRGLLLTGAGFILFFALEFAWEWNRLGRPGIADLSWAGQNNAKLVDVLSPMARAYNNVLAMLIATIGLAIPLTANMHTPKLIEMFLRDRINQVMLILFAFGAANVLWVAQMIGPNFAPLWAFRIAIAGALLGWIALIPYFFYVVRFLDPSGILRRLQALPAATIAALGAELAAVTDPIFPEITDRQVNLEYLAPDHRAAIEPFLQRAKERRRP